MTKAEKNEITSLVLSGTSIEDIAKKLKKTVAEVAPVANDAAQQIANIVQAGIANDNAAKVAKSTKNAGSPQSRDGVTIMTKAAAETGDAYVKKGRVNHTREECIHKPKG